MGLLGDFHIPSRCVDLPEAFKEMLVPSRTQYVLCTGNIGNKETKEWLETLGANKHSAIFVRGDCDEFPDVPESKVVKIGDFTIGIIHGHQAIPWGDLEALAIIQRELGCDILISGHTHVNKIASYDGKYFLNPGSVTGAYSPLSKDVIPSFMLMAIQGSQAIVYVYEFVDGKQKTTQTIFNKSGVEITKKEEKKTESESVPEPLPTSEEVVEEKEEEENVSEEELQPVSLLTCLLYTSPSPRDLSTSRMPSSA
eukprot:TRINITY_DN5227_c0_g2_i5.p1 TRINITY_DN5227_c0_g2~~TRINITY_DN5227_c0_g2_i5.p1  ORF type:complete len:254 (-),score=58.83 TRINITY_DN5227_c0_g2_i5:147-908(-)